MVTPSGSVGEITFFNQNGANATHRKIAGTASSGGAATDDENICLDGSHRFRFHAAQPHIARVRHS